MTTRSKAEQIEENLTRMRIRRYRLRQEARERTRASLSAVKRRQEDYEPWQRGLIQAAAIWVEKLAEHDDFERAARKHTRREKARRAAASKRKDGGPKRPRAAAGGHPSTAASWLIRCGVSTYRNARDGALGESTPPTYAEIAAFLVDRIAPRLPTDLRAQVFKPGLSKPAQKFAIASRLRRAATRIP